MDGREEYRLIMEHVAPLAALQHDIESATALKPTAMMLPLSVFPGVDEIRGLPVVRGDRTALLYEPTEWRS